MVVISGLMSTTQVEMSENQKTIYNIWMEEKNYMVQDVAHAYGDAISAQFALDALTNINVSVRDVFHLLVELYLTTQVLKNANWYLMNHVVSVEAMKGLTKHQQVLIQKVHPLN